MLRSLVRVILLLLFNFILFYFVLIYLFILLRLT
jgi:hypothetical protein